MRLFPGITAATARGFLSPPTCGLILETFGAGNAPQRADLMNALQEACERGVVIVAISQCAKGSVSADYETGIGLLKIGVVSGGDMTPEVCGRVLETCAIRNSYLRQPLDIVCAHQARIPAEQT
jgi:60kDa lysophospholipase